MISLELAEKLQLAGIGWNPKIGDWCYAGDSLMMVTATDGRMVALCDGICYAYSVVWVPQLDQLLDEIERHGYEWDLEFDTGGCYKYSCSISNKLNYELTAANTPEDAAGKALLWILEQEAKTND